MLQRRVSFIMSSFFALPFFSPNAAALGEGLLTERAGPSRDSHAFLENRKWQGT
jgi:hypothetical protein